jgi:hypothetical protein
MRAVRERRSAQLPAPRSEEIDMWIERIIRSAIGLILAVLAAIGLAAEIVPTLGLAPYTTATYCASKAISQWASGL